MNSIYDTIEGAFKLSDAITSMAKKRLQEDGQIRPCAVIGPRRDMQSGKEDPNLMPIMVQAMLGVDDNEFRGQIIQICKRTAAACVVTAAEFRDESYDKKGSIEVVTVHRQNLVIGVEHETLCLLRFETPILREGGKVVLGETIQTDPIPGSLTGFFK